MRSFLTPSQISAPSHAARTRPDRSGRAFWHRQTGAIGLIGGSLPALDAEAAQRALLYRSEAFAEDLGAGYAALRFHPAERVSVAP